MPVKGKLMNSPRELFAFIKSVMKKRLDIDERNEIIYDEINCFMKRYPEKKAFIEFYLKKSIL